MLVDGVTVLLTVELVVQQHVAFHRIQPDEFLAAECALVRLLARVLALVDGEVRPCREAFPAVLTTKRSLPGMHSHVNGQRARNAEAATAQDTLVTFLAAMRQHVLPHIRHRFSADLA